MDTGTDLPIPAFPFIEVTNDGRPHLVGQRCDECGTTYADTQRMACGKCGARQDRLKRIELSGEGRLHSGVIVRRGYPGVPVPFISAIVDLDEGAVLKGRLESRDFTPDDLRQGRRVRVAFDDALGRQDKQGRTYVAHHFEPVDE